MDLMYILKVLAVVLVIVVIAKYILHLHANNIITLIVNALIGLAVLWLLNYFNIIAIPTNLVTALVVGIFGLPGLLVLIALVLLNII